MLCVLTRHAALGTLVTALAQIIFPAQRTITNYTNEHSKALTCTPP